MSKLASRVLFFIFLNTLSFAFFIHTFVFVLILFEAVWREIGPTKRFSSALLRMDAACPVERRPAFVFGANCRRADGRSLAKHMERNVTIT